MVTNKSSILAGTLLFCLLAGGLAPVSEAAISRTSKRVLRLRSGVSQVASDFSAAALSTTSIQWSWSTGTFIDSGITEYRLYTGTPTSPSYQALPPGTSYYIDSGLGVNKMYLRWLVISSGTQQGSDSEHIEKYTYALPPDNITIPVSSINATNAYVTWQFSTATAYAIETSSDGGATYFRNREAFVPWQTIQLQSNTNYRIRLGAVNGDDELTPGVYSAVKLITSYPLDPALVGVAISSYAIRWQWSTGTFTGTGITGYNLYKSSVSEAASPPNFYENVVLAKAITSPDTGSWTEIFTDSQTAVANSRHARWLKADGILESEANTVVQKFTYAIAPATCSALYFLPFPTLHINQNSVGLNWNIGWSTTARNGIASSYFVESSTFHITDDWALPLTTVAAPGAPFTVTGLTENTKYDLRIGAVNGDGEMTPNNAQNPYAYSTLYRALTPPAPPADFLCSPFTDTALQCSWSTTTTTVNPDYISGYGIGEYKLGGVSPDQYWFWDPLDQVADPANTSYRLDYLMTNSSHTLTMFTDQTDPVYFGSGLHASDPDWYYNGPYSSVYVSTESATFATPPNDVVFDTVAARSVGMWWKEPEVPATQYRVERSTTAGSRGPWSFVANVTGNHFNDTGISISTAGLSPMTTYSYRIGAVNLLGWQTIGLSSATDGNRRDYSFAVTTVTKHLAPLLSGTGVSTTSINWSWVNTVPDVTSYNFYTATGAVISLGLSTTYYLEVNLSSANARYTRRVRSVAADGEGDYSEASASTLAGPPAAAVVTSSALHSLSLAWTAGAGAAAYKIDRSTDGVVWTVLRSSADAFSSTAFTDTLLRYATGYYYAIRSYNDDGLISVSSAVVAGMTLPLPSTYTVVFATAAASLNVTAALPGPGVSLLTVEIPAGAPDGYFGISTSAAASPMDIPKSALDTATAKLTNASLFSGAMVELHLYDVYGNVLTSNLPGPARITVTYADSAPADDIVDGTAIDAGTLRLYGLDTGALAWNLLPGSTLDKGGKIVHSEIPHFSFYALGSLTTPTRFSAIALSTVSIQWGWPPAAGIDGYYLYSSSTPFRVALSSSANYYVDTGLGVNKAYTRWLTAYSGAVEVSTSAHVSKYTFALPPSTIALSTGTAESMYVTWHFSTATAYAIECSTNGGESYIRNRESFVPWQTIPLISNKNYLIRVGAINGDDELTPGVYSTVRSTVTPPFTPELTAVPLSSYTIQWQWSTGTFTGTGITGYRLYHSTTTGDDTLPSDGFDGEIVSDISGISVSSWTEVFADSGSFVAANSRHTRWLKAVGIVESQGQPTYQKFTYAVAPASATAVWPDPAPYNVAHVWEDRVGLIWKPRSGPSEASKYVIDYSTVAGFAVAVASAPASGNPATVNGLTDNTKYDLRIGAINGDDVQTPENALNPFAYSQAYKLITSPAVPSNYSCAPYTDTALRCNWSTATYVNPDYIKGYFVGNLLHRTVNGTDEIYWDPWDVLPGVESHEYDLDYLLTNSTHTVSIWVEQKDPDWVPGNSHYDLNESTHYYNNFGSYRQDSDAATFATPPNDVVFDTVTAHAAGMWWKEPQVPATQYRVERSTNLGEDGPWIFVSSVSGSRYNDPGPSPGGLADSTTYSYRIGAINRLGFQTIGLSTATGGNRRDYSFVSSTMTRHVGPALSGTGASTTSINWSWVTAVPGVSSYNIYSATGGVIALNVPASPYLEVNLSSANARYSRRVRSVAYGLEGDYTEASASTLAGPPAAAVVTSSALHSLSLGWTAGAGAAAYRVDRSLDGNSWAVIKSSADVYVSTSFTDTRLRYSATYYYAIRSFNDDGAVSVSSAVTGASMTLPLPAVYTPVSAASAVSVTAPLPGPSLAQVKVDIPLGTPDGYFTLSTSAAASPVSIPKPSLDSAVRKLRNAALLPGSIVEPLLYDVYGSTSGLTAPARVTITYVDSTSDDIVDGTTPQAQVDMLRLYNLDTQALTWEQPNSALDKGTKSLYSDVDSFTFYALGSRFAGAAFSAAALSPGSIQWSWSIDASTGSTIDAYHLYSSSTSSSTYIVLPATAGFYIDTGLEVNTPYTRWLRISSAAAEGTDSAHVTKYTYALPPPDFSLSQVTSTGAYISWLFSTATAYDVQCSTNGGLDYTHNRASFVPWQTIQLLSNKNYQIRMGAINGDNEITPEVYSAVHLTTTPPLDMTMTGVAVSSYSIEWHWSTATIADTGITSYRIFRSTQGTDAEMPAAADNGLLAREIFDTAVSSWTEVFTDQDASRSADSRHTRWIKAKGILESTGRTVFQKYTYAIAPATCAPVEPHWFHVNETSLDLAWDPAPAHNYVIERSTTGSFTVPMSSAVIGAGPSLTSGLAPNTKYDFRLRAINGDGEVTPDDALNTLGYSAAYKMITRPTVPVHSCSAVTDTKLRWTWSTGTYTNMDYISGYGIGIASYTAEFGNFWLVTALIPGTTTNTYELDYLLTNSTHTRGIFANQTDPSCVTYSSAPVCYEHFGSYAAGSSGATFATPPNDVAFDFVGAHAVGLSWLEPEVPASGYIVQRSTNPGENGPWVFLSSVTGSQYYDTGPLPDGLAAGAVYSYRIGAVNRLGQQTLGLAANTGGNRRDYSFVNSTMTKHVSPTLYGVATGTNSIHWSWDDTVSGVTSYNLYNSTGGVVVIGLSKTTTFYSEVNLPGPNIRYTRRVRSIAPDGEGDYSEKAVSTWANPPAAVVVTSSGVHTMSVGWAANGSARYELKRSQDGNTWTGLKSWADAFNSTSFSDTHLHFAATYYYAVSGYNDDQIVSVSSAITPGSNMTLPVPSTYTVVYATAAASQSATAQIPGVAQLTVEIPAGAAPDGYIAISTSAAASPLDISKADLDAAKAKLVNSNLLDIFELHLYDAFGYPLTANLSSPARITITYTDNDNNDVVDGAVPALVSTLKIFNLDTTALVWKQQTNSTLDKGARSVYSDIAHFSFYALGSITSSAGLLADAFAYPNPYRPGSGGDFGESAFGDGIVFASLPARARVRIFSLSGAQVADLSDEDGDGRCLWNTRNPDGGKAASGVYFYIITGPGSKAKKTGKIAIIR